MNASVAENSEMQGSRGAAMLGFGRIWHHRLRPAQHRFSYPTFFLLLPMRSLATKPDKVLRRNRFGWLSFYDRDHGDGRDNALQWFDAMLKSEGVKDADGEVWLHTIPRILSHTFKPVSFWYAHRRDGSLAAILAEVNNTFGQRHCYLLQAPGLDWGQCIDAGKVFHVSPFCEVTGSYRFRFDMRYTASGLPAATRVSIDHSDDAGLLLKTSVHGRLEAFSAGSVRKALFGMPVMTLGIVARIHWHALRLWLKRVPFYRQPALPERFVSR